MSEYDTCCECEDDEEPCGNCRREIHEGWHARGWWWIRPEECTPSCPLFGDRSEDHWLAAMQPTARDRATAKQRARGGPYRGPAAE